MAQGGRGWFHRRRTQADRDPTPTVSTPAPTPAQAPPEPPKPTHQGHEDLRAPAASGPDVAMSPRQSKQGSTETTWRPDGQGATDTAVAEVTGGPREDATASWARPVESPLAETPASTGVSPATDQREAPIRETIGPGSPGPGSESAGASTRPSGPVDWDAETAAALTGEVEPLRSMPTHRAAPDPLLEDLIREIVGDTVVTTPATPTPIDAPLPTPSGARSPAPDFQAASTPPASHVPSPMTSSGASELTSEPAAGPAPQTSSSAMTESVTETSSQDTATKTAYEPLQPDVSRETSADDGGTPLAYELADETRRRIALDEAVLPLPPETRVLTISNQKGGVGKTTTAVNLAAALARAGAHVLVIDLDPQGNASTALGVDHRSDQQSVYEVLVADLPLDEVIRQSTEHEDLDCVPATIHLAGAEIELVSLVAREQRLRRALDAHLASMERPYDYVLIDCPPSLGLLTINAFVAAREVLIPIQCEYYALEGLSQLLSNIELIEKHLNAELRLSTILLTMYDSRTNLAQQVAQEVRDHFPAQTLETIIPRSVRVSEAPSYGQSVISYDFASSGSLSYREAAAEIARRGAAQPEESH
jgi:cellulose biosynthesis protein BcsQ